MPPTVRQIGDRPSGAHARIPSQVRTAHCPEMQSALLMHGRHSVESGQSVRWQAHPAPHVPVAGPRQVALMLTHRPVAPHHPQPARGVQATQLDALAQGSEGTPLSTAEHSVQGP